MLDNREKRSFAQASINTVIVLAGAPAARPSAPFPPIRFLQLKVPFNEAKNAELFEQVFQAAADEETPTYRLRVRPVEDLHAEGLQENKARYQAQKWGGIYLRAPSIYFTLLKKAGDKLVPLGQVAEVRRGFTTGANEFFYLQPTGKPASPGCLHVRNGAGWEGEIEEEYLKPAILSPDELSHIFIRDKEVKLRLFFCAKTKRQLAGTKALAYIKWGEANRYHETKTCSGRSPNWYDLTRTKRGTRQAAYINANYLVHEVMRFYVGKFFVSDNFQEWHVSEDIVWEAAAAANSTILQFFANMQGRANFGDGLMKIQTYEVSQLLIPDPQLLRPYKDQIKAILLQADRLGWDSPFREQIDEIVFFVLGLNPSERKAVYEAVVELVSARLRKAESVKGEKRVLRSSYSKRGFLFYNERQG
ncbi:MAG: hypothetical protein NZ933_05885 [Bacteroidia bacterium]|nr:hypothetical protein [Bacteroidia bacterium]